MSANDVMVDLETLGIRTTSVVLSIGAIDRMGNKWYRKLCPRAIQQQIDDGRTVDFSSLSWWMDQNEQAKKEAFGYGDTQQRVEHTLEDFARWLPLDCKIWGYGAAFDNAILRSLFNQYDLPCWDFHDDRCHRTMLSLAPQGFTRTVPVVAHNALSDAEAQMMDLKRIQQWLARP